MALPRGKGAVIVRLSIRYRWWVRPYLYGVTLMAYALGAEPDMAKVSRMVKRGIRVRLDEMRYGVEA